MNVSDNLTRDVARISNVGINTLAFSRYDGINLLWWIYNAAPLSTEYMLRSPKSPTKSLIRLAVHQIVS